MRIIGEENLYNRYTNVAANEKKEAEYLDNLIVDMTTQTKSMAASQAISNATNSVKGSRTKQNDELSASMPAKTTTLIDTTEGAATNAGKNEQRRKPIPQKFIGKASLMLDRKKVFSDNQVLNKSNSMGGKAATLSTATNSKTDKKQAGGAQGLKQMLKA